MRILYRARTLTLPILPLRIRRLTIELNQQNTANSKAGLAISIVGGIMLLLGTRQQLPADLVWSWLGALCIASLGLWLWLNQQPTQLVITVTVVICALFWALAGALFVAPGQLENAMLVAAIIITLTTAWPPLHIQKALFRHLFVLSIYIPLAASLCIHFKAQSPVFVGVLTIIYIALDRACRSYRQNFIDRALSNQRAEANSQQIVTTSKKITSLIEANASGIY